MKRYGLIGRSLGHSHSPEIFRKRFEELGIDHSHDYQAFELAHIQELPELLQGSAAVTDLILDRSAQLAEGLIMAL
ncbi:MAG: hypothetical protein EBU26_18840, partial [Verrucomicrobia bacterium]|nr:hypothetical protein [Verrucomicrobiota bacterium]